MKKNLLTFTLGIFLSTLTYAQNDSSKKDKEQKEKGRKLERKRDRERKKLWAKFINKQ